MNLPFYKTAELFTWYLLVMCPCLMFDTVVCTFRTMVNFVVERNWTQSFAWLAHVYSIKQLVPRGSPKRHCLFIWNNILWRPHWIWATDMIQEITAELSILLTFIFLSYNIVHTKICEDKKNTKKTIGRLISNDYDINKYTL